MLYALEKQTEGKRELGKRGHKWEDNNKICPTYQEGHGFCERFGSLS
jgi:hypothetical protein